MNIDVKTFDDVARQRGIAVESVIDAFQAAALAAYRKLPDSHRHARVDINRETGDVRFFARSIEQVIKSSGLEGTAQDVADHHLPSAKVEEIAEAINRIHKANEKAVYDVNNTTIKDLPEGYPTKIVLSEEFEDEVTNFGRIAANAMREVLEEKLREAEDLLVLGDLKDCKGQIITATVQYAKTDEPQTRYRNYTPSTEAPTIIGRGGAITLSYDMGGVEVTLPRHEQIPGEALQVNQRVKVFVADVRRGAKGAEVIVSRTHPGLINRLFEQYVPEMADGVVEIRSIAREAGRRTKIAVWANDDNLNAKGTFIGEMGARVRQVLAEIGEEKIDIIDWSADAATFASNALSPAKVTSAQVLDENAKMIRALVPEFQLSLAIGADGQNVRLAVRLTGWNIDVKPDK